MWMKSQGIVPPEGPSIKYVTLFLANFYPPLRHTSRDPPKVRHTSRIPPIFRMPSTKNLDKSHHVQILYKLFAGFLSGGVCQGSFIWTILSGVIFVRSLLHQKVKHHFKFHVPYV